MKGSVHARTRSTGSAVTRRGSASPQNPSYQTGTRGGTYRLVNGKKIYGKLKPRETKVTNPDGGGHGINNTSKAIPSMKKTLQGMPAVPGHEVKHETPAKDKKGLKDHIGSVARHFIPRTASGRVSLAGRMARLGLEAARVHASQLDKKYPGAGSKLKAWAVKKAVGYAMSTVGNHVAGNISNRVGAATKKRWGH